MDKIKFLRNSRMTIFWKLTIEPINLVSFFFFGGGAFKFINL